MTSLISNGINAGKKYFRIQSRFSFLSIIGVRYKTSKIKTKTKNIDIYCQFTNSVAKSAYQKWVLSTSAWNFNWLLTECVSEWVHARNSWNSIRFLALFFVLFHSIKIPEWVYSSKVYYYFEFILSHGMQQGYPMKKNETINVYKIMR